MARIKVDAEPGEVGFDAGPAGPDRPALPPLRRRGPARRLDGRRDPARAGRAPVAPRAPRPRGRSPGHRRHALAHLLDDQADHLGRGDDALRAGRAGADRPDRRGGSRPSPTPGSTRPARRSSPVDRAGHRADPGLAPAHPHLRPDLRLPPRAPGRRDVPAARATSSRRPPGVDLAARVRRVRASSRCCSSRAPSGTTASRPTCSAASSRWSPGSRSTRSSPSTSSARSAWTRPRWSVAEATTRPARHALHGRLATGSCATARLGDGRHAAARRCSPAAAGSSPRPATTTASPRCCCAAASSTASGCSARAPSPT